MIYWPTDGSAIEWAIPNNTGLTGAEGGDYTLALEFRNDVGLWWFDGNLDDATFTPNYILYGWTPDDGEGFPPDGEYTYTLRKYRSIGLDEWDEGEVIARGICIVGAYDERPAQFEQDGQTYEQFGQFAGW